MKHSRLFANFGGVDLNVESRLRDCPGNQFPRTRRVCRQIFFAQLMDFLPWTAFTRIVTRPGGDHRTRVLPCTEQFRILIFAQKTYRESLRDIEACLSAQAVNL